MSALPLVWERDLHQAPSPQAAVITPTLIVVQERHSKICRVSPADGSPLWVADVKNPWGWIACSAATCVYLNQHSLLQCFNLEDGVQRWAIELAAAGHDPNNIFGYPAVVDGHVIVGGWRGYTDVLAVSADDGGLVWTRPTRGHAMLAPVAGRAGTVLLPFPEEGRCTLVAAATGEELAEWSCPRSEYLPDASAFVVAHGGQFLCLAAQGRVVALTPAVDADWVEVARHPHPFRSLAPKFTESLLLFEDVRGMLCAYTHADMRRLWEAPVQHRHACLLPAAELSSGAVVFAANYGQLSVFDRGGRPVAHRGFRKRFRTDLSLTASGAVIACNGGRLIAVDTRDF